MTNLQVTHPLLTLGYLARKGLGLLGGFTSCEALNGR